jgi:uncharacterized membrane protein
MKQILRPFVIAVAIALGAPLCAQSNAFVPYLATVKGVPEGDVLNLRQGPSAYSDDVGDLANGDIYEITAINPSQKWARINVGEQTAWVSTAYLTPRTVVDHRYSCFGTEPFWSLSIDNLAPVIWSTPETEAETFTIKELTQITTQWSWRVTFEEEMIQGEIWANSCSDGMSDQSFGFAFRGKVQDRTIEGCCSLN